MALALKSPGVRRENVFLKPPVGLETGVPGFVGFAEPKTERPAVAATTAALDLSPIYNNGQAGAGATLTATVVGPLVIDRYTVKDGQRVLVKNQVSALENGIYMLTTVGSPSVTYVLTRATDFDKTADIVRGATVPVRHGAVNANKQFTMDGQGAITVGANPITFALAKLKRPETGVPFALHRKIELTDNFVCPVCGYLADAVAAFFDNGGERCYVVGTASRDEDEAEDKDERALKDGIDALAPIADLDLVAVPDAMMLQDPDAIVEVQRHAVAHCAMQGDRLAILDALPGRNADRLPEQRDAILRGQHEPVNAALYYPWLKPVPQEGPQVPSSGAPAEDIAEAARREGRWLVPPSGAVAGIFARTDARVGVHKAPANEEITGVSDLEINVDTTIQDRLNPEGINCLRAFPGRGIRVWGARTISHDPAWRYVNVRRLVLTLRRWIALNLAWAGFEPNGPALWIRIERELRGYLTELWLAGALSGGTPDAAFYIKCDSETNPPERRDNGEVVTEIGLAPSPPAEFVVVRVAQREGAADLLAR